MFDFSFDGQTYELMEASKYSHDYTYGLASYKNQALTAGCYISTGCNRKTELFNMHTLTWSVGPNYPFGE